MPASPHRGHVRVDPKFVPRIQQAAARERRSFNEQVNIMIEASLNIRRVTGLGNPGKLKLRTVF